MLQKSMTMLQHQYYLGFPITQESLLNRPSLIGASPPRYAREMYKIVAVVNGVATSVFDGTTQYRPFTTVHQKASREHGGGLYVYATIEDCLLGMTQFPKDSKLVGAARAIAVVLAWNEEETIPPLAYGPKNTYDFLQLVKLLPLPPSWRQTSKEKRHLARTQTKTIKLEMDVAGMEESLELARRLLGKPLQRTPSR